MSAMSPDESTSPTRVDESLLVSAYFRGGDPHGQVWISSSDQIITLSRLYTGDISSDDCVERFKNNSHVGKLYEVGGNIERGDSKTLSSLA